MSSSFLKNADDMFTAAAEHIDLPKGLADKVRLAQSLETMTGKAFPLSDDKAFTERPQEIDLVRSGLAEMMSTAFHATSQTKAEGGSDQSLRDAAYQIAIKRIAASYQAIGI